MKIVLAVDGSPTSNAAVAEVGRRPWPEGSVVRLITVDPPMPVKQYHGDMLTVFDELVRQQRAEAEYHLNAAVIQLSSLAPHLPLEGKLVEGQPKSAILKEAEKWGADLIVLGSNGYGSLQRLFLGSVSLAVATNAPCSVEIVRTPPDESQSSSTTS